MVLRSGFWKPRGVVGERGVEEMDVEERVGVERVVEQWQVVGGVERGRVEGRGVPHEEGRGR